MDYFSMTGDFLGILRETQKVFLNNKKLIASITTLTLSLYSILLLLNFFSIKPLIHELLVKQAILLITSPSSAEFANIVFAIKENIGLFAQVECIFVLIFSLASLFIDTATIHASAVTYREKSITFKDLLTTSLKSSKRVCITLFYVTLFGVGYIFLFLAFLFPILLLNRHPILSYSLSLLSSLFYSYIAIVWTLSIVVSALEERRGIRALGKAAEIVKGMELQGSLLNFTFTIFSFFAFRCFGLISINQSSSVQIIIGLFVLNSVCIIRMCWLMAYTVFYCECKRRCGEEIEVLMGAIEYSNLKHVPLIDEYVHDEREVVDVI